MGRPRPIKIFFGFAMLFLWLILIPQIPKYWANPLLIILVTLFFVYLFAVCILED